MPLREVFDIRRDFSLYLPASVSLSHTDTHNRTVHNHSLKTFLKTLLLSQRGFKELLFGLFMSGEKLRKFGNHKQETSKPLCGVDTHAKTLCDTAHTSIPHYHSASNETQSWFTYRGSVYFPAEDSNRVRIICLPLTDINHQPTSSSPGRRVTNRPL